MKAEDSLDKLHDIIEPAAAAWWPLAPGMFTLFILVIFAFVFVLFRAFIFWQKNHYRREAVSELERLFASNSATKLNDISALLKRTALTAYPRAEVANLTGDNWFNFLDRTGGTHFSGQLGLALEKTNYCVSTAPWDEKQLQELKNQVQHWIRHHAPPALANSPPLKKIGEAA